MKGKKVCQRCKKVIQIDEKGVLLMTFEGNKNLEKRYWHWKCYLEWRDESIKNHAEEVLNKAIIQVIPSEIISALNNGRNKQTNKVLPMGIS